VLGQVQLIKQLMPMIMTVPKGSERVEALAACWRAGLQVDLASRRASRVGDRAVLGADLKGIITDSFVLETISDSSGLAHKLIPWGLVGSTWEGFAEFYERWT
jgi:hypothetical protein